MIIGIDASNIRAGGGVTHLVELLRASHPVTHGFRQIIIWGAESTLSKLDNYPWLLRKSSALLERSLLHRSFWQRFQLSREAWLAGCNVLFVPGGSYAGGFRPIVTMSQNLLPFDRSESRRYGCTLRSLKLAALRLSQSRTFHRAEGLIFLTQYASRVVMPFVNRFWGQVRNLPFRGRTTIIPHGISKEFFCLPREQFAADRYSDDRPFRLLYVSTIDVYKHQCHVAQTVAQLRNHGFPVVLDLIGLAYPPALKRLSKTVNRLDPAGKFLRYLGPAAYPGIADLYSKADLFLFASSCENMPIILLEAMASGLPIASSRRGPMPEILGDSGVYFDPESPQEIALAVRHLIESPSLRTALSKSAYDKARHFSWEICAHKTFSFMKEVAEINA
jgi:glycosyltransferase involved in cell wall biosynthesis